MFLPTIRPNRDAQLCRSKPAFAQLSTSGSTSVVSKCAQYMMHDSAVNTEIVKDADRKETSAEQSKCDFTAVPEQRGGVWSSSFIFPSNIMDAAFDHKTQTPMTAPPPKKKKNYIWICLLEAKVPRWCVSCCF